MIKIKFNSRENVSPSSLLLHAFGRVGETEKLHRRKFVTEFKSKKGVKSCPLKKNLAEMIGKSCLDSGMRGMSGSVMMFAGWVFNFKDTFRDNFTTRQGYFFETFLKKNSRKSANFNRIFIFNENNLYSTASNLLKFTSDLLNSILYKRHKKISEPSISSNLFLELSLIRRFVTRT